MRAKNIIIIVLFIIIISTHYFVAVNAAVINSKPDISAFYCASRIVLDPNIPNINIYDKEIMRSISADYGISYSPMPFVYSVASVYIMNPLVLLSYENAKIVFNILNIILYVVSIIIILNLGRVSKLFLVGSMTILLLWMPFVSSQVWIQSNAIMIFLISLAVLAAEKERPIEAGFLIGIASLFKLFPLAFAVVLGLKNWRISAACALLFLSSFSIPGSLHWFSAIQEVHTFGESPFYTPLYTWLNQIGPLYFYLYAALITGLTALLAYYRRYADYTLLLSFAIPAAFLISPIVNYHHLTILALPYAYILTKFENINRWFLLVSISSLILINIVFRLPDIVYYLPVTVGLLLLWGAIGGYLLGIEDRKFAR
jgi:hypothetical protein